MRLEQDQVDPRLAVLHSEGDLNGQVQAEELIHRAEELIADGVRTVIVDLTRVDHVSSQGLGVLIRLHHRLRRRGGDLKIAGAGRAAKAALEVTRLSDVFEQFDTVQDARDAVTARA